jgi:hypothetical protein
MEWHEHTDESLIAYAASHQDFSAPAAMEMQRRMAVAIKDFNESSAGQARTMIRLTWAIAVLTVVMAAVAAIQLWAMLSPQPTKTETTTEWSGFVYSSLESQRGKAIDQDALRRAPTFDTVQQCVEWGRAQTVATPAAGFECATGCRVDQGIGEVVCRDSTRVMR